MADRSTVGAVVPAAGVALGGWAAGQGLARAWLGGIRRAGQGVSEILPRAQARGISQESRVTRTVRVVSTIDFIPR